MTWFAGEAVCPSMAGLACCVRSFAALFGTAGLLLQRGHPSLGNWLEPGSASPGGGSVEVSE